MSSPQADTSSTWPCGQRPAVGNAGKDVKERNQEVQYNSGKLQSHPVCWLRHGNVISKCKTSRSKAKRLHGLQKPYVETSFVSFASLEFCSVGNS